MSNGGWIKLHRSVLDNPVVFAGTDYFAVWIYLLLKAVHKDGTKVMCRGVQYTLSAGQLITSRRELGEQLKISEAKIQRILTRLQNEQMIEQQTTRRNRVITILNWDRYQQGEQQVEPPSEQQTNHRRTTDEPQTEQQTGKLPLSNKNIKNDDNDNNITRARVRARHAVGVPVNNHDTFPQGMKLEQRKRLEAMRENVRAVNAELALEEEGDGHEE